MSPTLRLSAAVALAAACSPAAPRIVTVVPNESRVVIVDESPPPPEPLPRLARVVRIAESDGVHLVFDWDRPARDAFGAVQARVRCPGNEIVVAPFWIGGARMETVLPWSAASSDCSIEVEPAVRDPIRYRFDLGG